MHNLIHEIVTKKREAVEPQFFRTMMGRKFYEADVPRLVRALERIAIVLEKMEVVHDKSIDDVLDAIVDDFQNRRALWQALNRGGGAGSGGGE